MLLNRVRSQLLSELTGDGKGKLSHAPIKFSMEVEKIAQELGISLLDSLSGIVEQYELEPEEIAKMVTPTLKQKLALEQGIEKPGAKLKFL